MASNNIARLGVVLGLDTAEFTASIDKAIAENKKLGREIRKDNNAAVAEIANLKNATEDYGKTLTKLQIIEREINQGRFKFASDDMKQRLRDQAKAYDAVAISAAGAQKAMGLTDQQKLGMTYQVTDFFTQVASGQNVMIAAIQQGGQLKDQMGGLGNMFKALGTIFTPTVVGLTGVAAILGTVAYQAYVGSEEIKKLNNSLILTGQYSGATQSYVESLSSALGDKLNVSSRVAKDAINEIIASGKLTIDTFGPVSTAIIKFSQLTGTTAKEAAQKLLPAITGNINAIKELNNQHNFLTIQQYRHIEALLEQNKKQEAAKEVAKALNKTWGDTTENLGTLDRLVKESTKTWDNFWSAVSNVGKPKDPVERIVEISKLIKEAQDKLALLPSNAAEQSTMQEGIANALRANIQKLRDEQDALIGKERAKAEKFSIGQTDKSKIDTARPISEYRQHGKESAKAELEARYAVLMMGKTEEQKAELEFDKAVELAKKEEAAKNAQEQNAFAKDNAIMREAAVVKAAVDRAEKLKKIADDQYNYIFGKQEEARQQEEEEKRQAFAILDAYALTGQAKKEQQALDVQALERAQERFRLENNGAVLRAEDLQYARDLQDIEWKRLDNIKAIQRDEKLTADAREQAIQRENAAAQKSIDLANERNRIAKELQSRSYETGVRSKIGEFIRDLPTDFELGQKAFSSFVDNMSTALENFVRTGKLSFKDFARSVIQDIMAMQLKASANRLIGSLLQSFAPSFGAPTIPSAIGFGARAEGGPVYANNAHLVGEKGPEIFVPSSAGTIIPNHAMGAIGGVTNVTNNYINAIDTKSFEDRILGSSKAVWAANQYGSKNIAVGRGRT